MILKHPFWEFDVNVYGINTLVIENAELFRKILVDLNNQVLGLDGGFKLFEDTNEKSLKDEAILVNSPFLISLNDRKMLNKLYTEIKSDILSTHYESFQKIESSLLFFLDDVLLNNSIDLEINDSIEITELLKISGLKFRENIEGLDLIEKILQYILVVQQFISPSFFIFTNIKGIFLEEEWDKFISDLILRNINILVVENKNEYESNLGEIVYTIDVDQCEIY